MTITPLSAHHIAQLAHWHHAEWSHLNPGQSLSARTAKLQLALADGLPQFFVAEQGNCLLGSAALVECDMDTHAHWHPWLASVYVEASRRGMGTGAALVRHTMNHAQQLGFKRLYLFTPDAAAFYHRLGWHVLQQETYRGSPVTVMTCALAT